MTAQVRRFEGKVAFVTGAGSGIGRETALAFSREGAAVVVTDRSEDGNKETAALVEQAGGEVLAVACDVTSEADVAAALEATVTGSAGSTRRSTTRASNSRCGPCTRSAWPSSTG